MAILLAFIKLPFVIKIFVFGRFTYTQGNNLHKYPLFYAGGFT